MVYLSSSPIKRTRAQKILRLIVGVIAVSLILWALYSIPYDILREERARLYGEIVTSGQVLEVRTDVTPRYPEARLVIRYTYVDPDGFARFAEARIPDSQWQKFQPGAVIEVIYGRTQPALVRVPGEVEPRFQVWLRELIN
ncbi:DUF3592 domain-containing protein [Pseudodesulfovibrio sediminis]|uniref:DUF3592 domain-containing protein n=1 Tax=Pseudodesulfovibrio sediminis TaxID=2810563 RepID=A0ABN6EX51_9BACT|nr:DUF3592 domain-containing protein [Pseudodesulfovibrio sediminis]BCS90112.1 hypothetical protein PSDVSF_33540 [Pseudodesulfovibrio sediminis]